MPNEIPIAIATTASIEWGNVFQAIPNPILILTPDLTVVAANRAVIGAVGRPLDEILGKKCFEVFHRTADHPNNCPLQRVLASHSIEIEPMEIEAFGGVFLVSCTPLLNEQGDLHRIIHIATNTTAQKAQHLAAKLLCFSDVNSSLPKHQRAKPEPSQEQLPVRFPRGNETILVVEDDDLVREAVRNLLCALGYHVITGKDGPSALAVALKHTETIHLLLSDVILPGMNGLEVCHHLALLHGESKVLYMSGYVHENTSGWGAHIAAEDLLHKPFTLATLANAVRNKIDNLSCPERKL